MSNAQNQVEFWNLTIPNGVADHYKGQLPDFADQLCNFAESVTLGLKFSMSFKSARNSYCVAVTLDAKVSGDPSECATFWGGTPGTALAKAYIATFVFKAVVDGWAESFRSQTVAQIDLKQGHPELLPRA